MIVVESSAIIAILKEESEAGAFKRILATNDQSLMGAPNVLEALTVAGGNRGTQGQETVQMLLRSSGIRSVPFRQEHAALAAEAFLQYGKGRHKADLNYGDCMAYALAKSLDAPLLYKGDDFAKTDIRSALSAE